MKQKPDTKVKNNAFKRVWNVDIPRTRAYIKQETNDSKESLRCALYSPVKIESPSLEISNYESDLSKAAESKHCSICNINFWTRGLYLAHELHSHKTKETPIIGLKNLCCNICNKSYKCATFYRRHMANLNNTHVPLIRANPKPNPLKAPDIKDPNNYFHNIPRDRLSKEPRKPKNMTPTIDILNMYCDSCNTEYNSKGSYIRHLVQIHGITLPEA
ncbi:hypothetical protein BDF21DRAFT_459243 [Thamnidium elegans]|nr:hypothetical protein BDF21DRAFT_459243 [Thamnidium elegans]